MITTFYKIELWFCVCACWCSKSIYYSVYGIQKQPLFNQFQPFLHSLMTKVMTGNELLNWFFSLVFGLDECVKTEKNAITLTFQT